MMSRPLKRRKKKRRTRKAMKGGEFPNFLQLNRKFANYLAKQMGVKKRV